MDLNMDNILGKMMEMQQKLAEVQENLKHKTVTAEAGGGMVKVTANGLRQIVSITIDPEVVNPEEIDLLEDLVVAGVNKALAEAEAMAQQEMARATAGFMPPGFPSGQAGA